MENDDRPEVDFDIQLWKQSQTNCELYAIEGGTLYCELSVWKGLD